jgi:hypothetical protein
VIRIGAGQGFSGDDLRGCREIVHEGVDYVCCEALAEMTLHWMQAAKDRDPDAGYAHDLSAIAEIVLPAVGERRTRLVTNAGALNPEAARRVVGAVARKLGLRKLRVAVVEGSDLSGRIAELHRHGVDFRHLDSGAEWGSEERVNFAVAYLGAFPIAEALAEDADVVITGRVADASVFMGPAIFKHRIARDDWDRLARIAVVGHLLECSSQVTGGNFSGPWWEVSGLDAVGFPIAEVSEDGDAVITKPAGTGGRVSVDTVKEQLLYEVGDPRRYLTPDVAVDFTAVRLEDIGADRVRVSGGRGAPAPLAYKVITSRAAGWSASVSVAYSYPHALAKAKAAAQILGARLGRAGVRPLETYIEYFGAGALFGEANVATDCPEIVLRYAIRCATHEEAVVLITERLYALALAGPPASTGSGSGPAGPSPLFEIWPTLVPRELVDPGVRVSVVEV